jgi:polysaccharide biosynthesis protein PslJ
MARRASTAVPQNGGPDSFVLPQAQERTPWLLGFLCLLIALIPPYMVLPGPLKSNGSPAKMIAVILSGLTILGFLLVQRKATTRTLRPGVLPLLVFFLLIVAVYGVGVSKPGSDSPDVLIGEVATVGLALYAMTRVDTVRQRSVVLGFLAVGLTFNCAVGLLQTSTSIDLHLLFQPPGFVDNQVDLGRGFAAASTERFGAKRAVGTSGHPIEFAVLAAITVPLCLHFARSAANRKVRLLAALSAIVALLAMATGISRSGVIALAVAFLVYMWTFKVREFGVAVGAAVVALLIGFAAAPRSAQALWNTITNSAGDGSVLERVDDYAKVSQTFRAHPWFGIGLGRATPIDYGWLDNQWLGLLVEGGVVGLAAMIALASGGIFGISAALRAAATRRERDQAYMMGAMFVGILSSSFTFDLFAFQQATLLFFILFGLLWSTFTISLPEATAKRAARDPASFG